MLPIFRMIPVGGVFIAMVALVQALTLPGHSLQVNSLKFAPGGRSLASCSHDGSVRIWRAEPGP